MWVIKLGGAMNTDASLPEWLSVLSQHGGGRVVLVSGGGSFADEVRRTQAHWGFHDLAAHNMALLAMAQTACMYQALSPTLRIVSNEAGIQQALAQGKVPVWSPHASLSEQVDANTNWDVTSDSLALSLAQRLQAQGLILVKSFDPIGLTTPAQWGQAGWVDARFSELAQEATLDIALLFKERWGDLAALLAAMPSHMPVA